MTEGTLSREELIEGLKKIVMEENDGSERKFGIIIFGSRVKGTNHSDSDVDLAPFLFNDERFCDSADGYYQAEPRIIVFLRTNDLMEHVNYFVRCLDRERLLRALDDGKRGSLLAYYGAFKDSTVYIGPEEEEIGKLLERVFKR